MSGQAELLRAAAKAMRERAEADGSRGWMKVDFNEGDDPASARGGGESAVWSHEKHAVAVVGAYMGQTP